MSNILSSITQLNVGGIATDLINSQPLGKTAALRAIAMNYASCSAFPLIFPDPLDLNLWNAVFTIYEPQSVKDQAITLILPNFNQTGLLVEVVSIILQPVDKSLPPYVSLAPMVNLEFWAKSTQVALAGSSPLYDTYSFYPGEFDKITNFYGLPKYAIITVAFKGSSAN